MERTHIALQAMGGAEWTAGTVYLENLFYAIRKTFPDEVKLSVMVPESDPGAGRSAELLEPDAVIAYNRPERWTPSWAVNGLVKKALLVDPATGRALAAQGVEVLFGPVITYRYKGIATLSMLPDFQHVRLPEMFDEEERRSRDSSFMQSARVADVLVLPSEPARKDFVAFAPPYAHKAKAMHPLTRVPDSTYERDPGEMTGIYNIPEKFIYLPNQFWKHKNHQAAFKAVGKLKENGTRVCIVCTGNASDYRHPTHFPDLMEAVSADGIREQVIYLGLVPHEHVLLLMRQSVCVLNPSLFEGWGVTVDEARSLGKRVLVSDIPEHRSHNAPRATYFDPQNADDLAEKMGSVWEEAGPGPDHELEAEARRELPGRIRAYAETFMSVAREALSKVRYS